MPDFARPALFLALAIFIAAPLAAKDSLGVFSGWAAFRDPSDLRCYAIAKPELADDDQPVASYASIGSWPNDGIRNQIHIRLSRETARNAQIILRIGRRNFSLRGSGSDAWARDAAMDASIVAAIRSADRMTVRSIAANGRRFSDSYALAGAATAIDAATLACSNRAR